MIGIEDTFLKVAVIAIANVAFIILGEKPEAELRWEQHTLPLPGREALAPVVSLVLLIVLGVIPLGDLGDPAATPGSFSAALHGKTPIILLILAFAAISNGLANCGFFDFAAYKAVEKCDRDTGRLILYLFIVCSIMTLFTSNDIVILTMTPIIYSICVHAQIKNGKLLFLAQFVAANTLSMGLMIGSPTNIILAEQLDISFLRYFFLMAVPAVAAFIFTFSAIEWINRRSTGNASGSALTSTAPGALPWVKGWQFEPSYRIPARAPRSNFTRSMSRWIWLFVFSVLSLVLVTAFDLSLNWSSAFIFIATLILQWFEAVTGEKYQNTSAGEKLAVVANTVLHLPYGIIFFGLAFFTFAAFLSTGDVMNQAVLTIFALVENNELISGPVLVFLSGLLVNLVNDLPAAAMIADGISANQAMFNTLSSSDQAIVLQALLIGLNIGCYVTPIGALAGLLWFSQMNKEAVRQRSRVVRQEDADIALPTRGDLIKYGLIVFAWVGLLLGLFVPFWSIFIEFLALPVSQFATGLSAFGEVHSLPAVFVGLLVSALLIIRMVRIFGRNRVALSHMSEIFTILNKIAIWSFKHRVMYICTLLALFAVFSGAMLFWIEAYSFSRYGIDTSLYRDGLNKLATDAPVSFAVWFTVFLGSAFEQMQFPQSLLGQVLVGLLPLSAIAAVLHVANSTSEENLAKLRRSLGLGKIPNSRVIVVNHQAKFESTARMILERRNHFMVLLCRPWELERARVFADELMAEPALANRVLALPIDLDSYATLKNLDFASAAEIYFLSDLRGETDVDNMKMLTRIDAWLNARRVAAAEELARSKHSHPTDHAAAHGDFMRIPKMFFEASSQRQLERVQSTLSELTEYQTVCTTFDGLVVDQLVSDVFCDRERLHGRFRLGGDVSQDSPDMFARNAEALRGVQIVMHKLPEESCEAVRSLLASHFENEAQNYKSAKIHAVETRIALQDQLQAIASSRTLPLAENSTLIGVYADLADRRLPMSVANAVVSSQSLAVGGVIELRRSIRDDLPAGDALTAPKQQTIYLFNFNQYADSFLRRMKREPDLLDRIRAVIIVDQHTNIPDDIARAPFVTVRRRMNLDDAVSIVMPNALDGNELRPSSGDPNDGLKRGDSIVVFTDYENIEKSNVEMIQFIESLDFRLNGQSHSQSDAWAKDILLTVECNNEETRFLFEHLSVDKILDTSRLRVSFLEQFAELYHCFEKRMNDRSFGSDFTERRWGQFHPTIFNFKRAMAYSDYFKSFTVRQADRFFIYDESGKEISVVGLSCGRIEDLLAKYSEPPLTLAAICSMHPIMYDRQVMGEYGCGPQMLAQIYDADYVVGPHDSLVMISLV